MACCSAGTLNIAADSVLEAAQWGTDVVVAAALDLESMVRVPPVLY